MLNVGLKSELIRRSGNQPFRGGEAKSLSKGAER
jgi:hypothetical protein